MAEKKIVTLGIRMDESMLIDVKKLAERAGMTESAYSRMAIYERIERERAEYIGLHSIFGDGCLSRKDNTAQPRTALDGLSDLADLACQK